MNRRFLCRTRQLRVVPASEGEKLKSGPAAAGGKKSLGFQEPAPPFFQRKMGRGREEAEGREFEAVRVRNLVVEMAGSLQQ